MATKSAAARKTVSIANLSALGPETLATLLVAVASGDTNWRRRLKLELAAEVGPADLALEIDKRLVALEASRTKVSWRKRPDLIEDLRVHLRMIVDRLAAADARMGLDRLVAWFDLQSGLSSRVKDPKGELAAMFFDAAPDLAAVASAVGPEEAGPVLAEAVLTRLSEWGGWIGRAAPDMSLALAADLLARLTTGRPRPTGRLALVVRKLADRAGDVAAWAASIPDEERGKPDVGAEIARRMAAAGHPAEARAALEAARPRPPQTSRWALRAGASADVERSNAWDAAEAVVLEAEGDLAGAQDRRWALFERTLAEAPLRDFLSRLADFDDVEALDRAHALAAAWPDAGRGLAFLIGWPALGEAARMILARSDELRPSGEDAALWASRLEARYPNAALALVRARAIGLCRLGLGRSDEVRALAMEAQGLAEHPGALEGLPSHAEFIDALEAASAPPAPRRPWR